MISVSVLERLERQLKESVATSVVPMSMNVDPDTFSGPAPIEMGSKCSCKGGSKPCSCKSKGTGAGMKEKACDCSKKSQSVESDEGCGCGESFEPLAGCICEQGPCICDASLEENKSPTKLFIFSREVKNGSDKRLPLGYTYTKFLSLLQRMVAPLKVHNAPGSISVIASPALEKGLRELARKEGMTIEVADQIKKGDH